MVIHKLIGTNNINMQKYIGRTFECAKISVGKGLVFVDMMPVFSISEIKDYEKIYGCTVLKTLNSIYVLENINV